MIRPLLLAVSSLLSLHAQEMKPMVMTPLGASPSRASARADWVRLTNARFEMSGKSTRVAAEGADGLTAVILMRGLEKARHAKKILLGKDEHALIFHSVVAEGFNRIVARNPETGDQWSARIEQGKAMLEF